jgi:hypothetical protein
MALTDSKLRFVNYASLGKNLKLGKSKGLKKKMYKRTESPSHQRLLFFPEHAAAILFFVPFCLNRLSLTAVHHGRDASIRDAARTAYTSLAASGSKYTLLPLFFSLS